MGRYLDGSDGTPFLVCDFDPQVTPVRCWVLALFDDFGVQSQTVVLSFFGSAY